VGTWVGCIPSVGRCDGDSVLGETEGRFVGMLDSVVGMLLEVGGDVGTSLTEGESDRVGPPDGS